MLRILSLSTFGLLVLAGASSAQQATPTTSTPASPAVQSQPQVVESSGPVSSGRFFGRRRGAPDNSSRFFGRRGNRSNENYQAVTSQPVAENLQTMPRAETKTATTTETTGTKDQTVTAGTTQPVAQPAPSNERPTRRGGLRSRLSARLGR
jgi:hypothetical protein